MNREIEQILDLARWAPSGDNEQPWRFEIVDDQHFVIHGRDTSDWCVYDLGGRASQIAIGALLENIQVAASGQQIAVEFSRRPDQPENKPIIDVTLLAGKSVIPSEWLPVIEERVTNRRAYSAKPLSAEQKTTLEDAAGEDYEVLWIEGRKRRWQMAKLLFKSAYIRLTTPEAYEVHRQNIEWGVRHSADKLPSQAIGVDLLTQKIMRWTLQSWRRVQLMNRYCAGTIAPRIQLDLIPGFRCAAHFIIVAKRPLETIDDYMMGGRAAQRFWLAATKLGLQFQPEMTPLIFSSYVEQGRKFTRFAKAAERAKAVRQALNQQAEGINVTQAGVFMGRVGVGQSPKSRSVRKDLNSLIYQHKG